MRSVIFPGNWFCTFFCIILTTVFSVNRKVTVNGVNGRFTFAKQLNLSSQNKKIASKCRCLVTPNATNFWPSTVPHLRWILACYRPSSVKVLARVHSGSTAPRPAPRLSWHCTPAHSNGQTIHNDLRWRFSPTK